jgi:hypothetical protein
VQVSRWLHSAELHQDVGEDVMVMVMVMHGHIIHLLIQALLKVMMKSKVDSQCCLFCFHWPTVQVLLRVTVCSAPTSIPFFAQLPFPFFTTIALLSTIMSRKHRKLPASAPVPVPLLGPIRIAFSMLRALL